MSLFDVAAAADIRPRSSCSIEQLPVISAAATVSCSSLYTRPKSAAVSPHSKAAVGCVVSCYCDQLWKVAVWRAGQMSATIPLSIIHQLFKKALRLPSRSAIYWNPCKVICVEKLQVIPPPSAPGTRGRNFSRCQSAGWLSHCVVFVVGRGVA